MGQSHHRQGHTHTVEMSASVVVNASTSFIQVEDESRTELFPSNVLADLDLNASSATFNPALSVANPGEGLVVRSLCLEDYDRGKQLGKLLVTTASLLAVKLGCYKVTLNCNDKMIKFYASLGYKSEDGNSNYMCIRVQGKPREPQA